MAENTGAAAAVPLPPDLQVRHEAVLKQSDAMKLELTPQAAYKSCWNYFIKWVKSQRDNHELPPEDKYITDNTVNLFFGGELQNLNIQPTSAARYVPAIQWYADNREYLRIRFVVERDLTKTGKLLHKQQYALRNPIQTGPNRIRNVLPGEDLEAELADPFAHLPTNVVTWEDTKKAFFYICSSRPSDWFAILPMWSWSIATSLRNCSILVVCLSDMFLDYAHGAESSGPLSRCIALVLRKGTGKENFTQDRLVAAWRGLEYWMCSNGQIATSLLYRLNIHGEDIISFLLRDQKEDCFWRNIPLIDKDTYGKCYSALKEVMKACDIIANKVTHFGRVFSIDTASFLGRREDQIRRGQTTPTVGVLERATVR
eukprot:scaffold241088_cov53-Attheya_sp.AAC.1